MMLFSELTTTALSIFGTTKIGNEAGIQIIYQGKSSDNPQVNIQKKETEDGNISFNINNNTLTIQLPKNGQNKASEIVTAWNNEQQKGQFEIIQKGNGDDVISEGSNCP